MLLATTAVLAGAAGARAAAQDRAVPYQGIAPRTAPVVAAFRPHPAVARPTSPPAAQKAPSTPVVLSVRPAPGATNVSTGARIFVRLSAPPLPRAPVPALAPPVAGEWAVNGQTLTFTPADGYQPWSSVHVSFPRRLAKFSSTKPYSFKVGPVPLLRVQEALAELHYLPLRFGPTPVSSALRDEATVPAAVRTTALPGVFSWRYPDIPASLAALWAPGQMSVLTQGAVMAFERRDDLPADGVPGRQFWGALRTALAHRDQDLKPYDYLMVSESLPEGLVVWQDGKDVFETPVNTGVPGAQTPLGTWPVYERLVSTTMAGTDPDGVHYDVSGVPWVAYFNGGDAVHGYWRTYFGYPQSNGCVELPIPNAAVVWTMDPIGTLVSVLP
jgi:hypothetical protein